MKRDISETIGIGIILAISGGLMDAYSYICRGQVFANAQTGNILLLSISLSTGDISGFLHHFYPVVAFASGIALAILLRHLLSDHFRKHWQLSVLFVEAALVILLFGDRERDRRNAVFRVVSVAQYRLYHHFLQLLYQDFS